METIQLLSINQGPCEACRTDTWTYRVHIRDEELEPDGILIRFCELCVKVHSELVDSVIIDRINNVTIYPNNFERSSS